MGEIFMDGGIVGRNVFGDKVYRRYYRGDAPSGLFSRITGFAKLFSKRSSRSWEEVMGWGRNFGILQKLKTVSTADIIRLKNADVTLDELKLWSKPYGEAIGKKVDQSNVIAKYRKDFVDKLIELWQ